MDFSESSDKFCPSYPVPHIVSLTEGCSKHSETSYNVGRCPNDPCTEVNEGPGGCGKEKENYCCGSTDFSIVELDCEDDSDEFILAVRELLQTDTENFQCFGCYFLLGYMMYNIIIILATVTNMYYTSFIVGNCLWLYSV